MRKVVLLVLLILVIILGCGCMEIEVSRTFNRNGTVVDTVTVLLNEELLNEHGYTLEYARNSVVTKLLEYGYTVEDNTEQKVVIGVYVFDSLDEFEKIVANSSSTGEGDGDKEDLLFIYQENSGDTPFRRYIINGTVEEIRSTEFPNIDKELLNDVKYSYKYVTPYKSIESNAELKYVNENNLYVHEWRFNALEAELGIMKLNQRVPNQTVWYGIVIAILVSILLIKEYIKDRNQWKKEKKEED